MDNADMSGRVDTAIPLTYHAESIQHVVLAGDCNQVKPRDISNSDIALADGVSLFERLMSDPQQRFPGQIPES